MSPSKGPLAYTTSTAIPKRKLGLGATKRSASLDQVQLENRIAKPLTGKDYKRIWKMHREKFIDYRKGPSRQQLFLIYHLIMNQKTFVYGHCKALAYYLKFTWCRNRASLKYRARNESLLNAGIAKMGQKLDVINLVKRSNDSTLIKKVTLNSAERFLLEF